MTTAMSTKDWELISAYIDGRLSSYDRLQLEQRLQSDADLRSAYKSLLRTRIVLKEVRRVKRRRNFYLTPGMLQRNNWLRLIPVLNFGSAAAIVLAIIFFVADVFPAVMPASKSDMVSESIPVIQDSAPLPAAAPQIAGEPDILLSQTPVEKVTETLSETSGAAIVSPQTTPLPAAKLLANTASDTVPTREEESPDEASPTVEEPLSITELNGPEELAQAAQAEAEMAPPSMKAFPSEPLMESANRDGMPTSTVEEYSAPEESTGQAVEQNSQLIETQNVPALGFGGEPSKTIVVETFIPTITIPMPTASQQIMANQATIPTNEPVTNPPEFRAAPSSDEPIDRHLPSAISQAEFLIKIIWISLLAISGILAILSIYIRKKSI